MEPRGTAFAKSHRRFTIAAMVERAEHEDFYMLGSRNTRSPQQEAHDPFEHVVVFPRRRDVQFDASETQYFEGLMFSDSYTVSGVFVNTSFVIAAVSLPSLQKFESIK